MARNGAAARDPRIRMRIALGTLVLLNLIALWFVVSPPGGSVEELDAQLSSKRGEVIQRRTTLERSRRHIQQVEQSRDADATFEDQFFTDRKVASSTFIAELTKTASETGLRPKEHVFLFEPVDGSDSLSMMTITASYEGTYSDLLQAMNRLDRSSRFLILDSLSATPQQATGLLNVTVRLNAFVKEGAESQ